MLRPAWTEQLASRLLRGKSINIEGEHGLGRRQTLTDLTSILPAEVNILKANLRHYPQSMDEMLADLSAQAGLPLVGSFEALLEELSRGEGHTVLILHNFDELLFGAASGFDAMFMAHLNAMESLHNVALLCVTVALPAQWRVNIDTLPLTPLP